MKKNKTLFGLFSLLSLVAIISCQPKPDDVAVSSTTPTPTPTPTPTISHYLYFAAGACYVGPLTATKAWSATTSGLINRIDLDLASPQGQPIMDYFSVNAGDFPVGITSYSNVDEDYLLATIENTAGRRIDIIPKSGSNSYVTWKTDGTALASGATPVIRSIAKTSDGFLVVKSTSIEKFNNGKSRVLANSAAYVNAPSAPCSPSNTALVGSAVHPTSGNIYFIHGAASPNNKIGVIKAAGTATGTAADCMMTPQAAPTVTSMPTSIVFVSATQILVSWISTAPARDYIYAYDLVETTNTVTFSNATDLTSTIYSSGIIRGISAMAWDSTNSHLYVSNGSTSAANTIEKFSYVPATKTLTRVGSVPWLAANFETQCINSMFIE